MLYAQQPVSVGLNSPYFPAPAHTQSAGGTVDGRPWDQQQFPNAQHPQQQPNPPFYYPDPSAQLGYYIPVQSMAQNHWNPYGHGMPMGLNGMNQQGMQGYPPPMHTGFGQPANGNWPQQYSMGPMHVGEAGDDDELVIVMVANLPWKIRWQDLKDLTRKFTAKVERAEVYCHEDGHSKGFGYISVRGHDAANMIISQLDGYDYNGRKLKARIGSIPQARKASECLSDTPVPTNWDRILSGTTSPGNASPALSHASHFTHNTDTTLVAGSSSSHHPVHNHGHHHGNNSNLNPSAAIYTLSPHSQLPVNIANGVVEIEPRGIFIGNVPFNTTWMELKDHLRAAGNILRCDVPHFADGKPRGYAVALFETPKEAKEAVALFDGTPFAGRALRVRLDRFCETKNPRTPRNHQNGGAGAGMC
ncbi:hypothetical protein BJ508DRAFT_312535 [Ascobolus immersus RN42]|uniref:RRM domain-containing protein n=1 Tax=Ascobolus immersus RN42 TaxID=1160509 RepID=A0A3N4HYU4_ASCIM|nr:hypothetical protein BJ508DRAFT_312535 [Ascobolus immersus RN42]